jgi:hypothetical protein
MADRTTRAPYPGRVVIRGRVVGDGTWTNRSAFIALKSSIGPGLVMKTGVFRSGIMVLAFLAPVAGNAANGIGGVTGTSTPQVVTPSTSPAPQTPANPSPAVGATAPAIAGPPAVAHNRAHAPVVVRPVR